MMKKEGKKWFFLRKTKQTKAKKGKFLRYFDAKRWF